MAERLTVEEGTAYGGGMLLAATDALPRRPRRVLVAGTSGAGKTSLAARLGQALELPHVEIDVLFHGPGWTPRQPFACEVEAFSAQPGWVTEWQYGSVRALLAERADLLVWLDLPRGPGDAPGDRTHREPATAMPEALRRSASPVATVAPAASARATR